MGGSWLTSPADKYGASIGSPGTRATPDATAVTTVAPAVQPKLAGMVTPHEPAFWFAVLAGVTVGLMAYSTVETRR